MFSPCFFEVIWAPITIKNLPAANGLWRHVSRFPAHALCPHARRRRWKCSVTLLADLSTFSFCTSLQLWVLYFLWALFFLCYGCGRVGSAGSTIDWLCLGYFSRRWANQVIFFFKKCFSPILILKEDLIPFIIINLAFDLTKNNKCFVFSSPWSTWSRLFVMVISGVYMMIGASW